MPCAGEYRNLQQRLTNNAESVAFYGGIDREGSLIKARFRQLVKHQAHLLRTQWRFSMWQVLPRLRAWRSASMKTTQKAALCLELDWTAHRRM